MTTATEQAPTDLADLSVHEFAELVRLSTHDETGTHFAHAGYQYTAELEGKGLLAIGRCYFQSVQDPDGSVRYSEEYDTVARTELGEEVITDCIANGIASQYYLPRIVELLDSCLAEGIRQGYTGPLEDWCPWQGDIDYVTDGIGFEPSDSCWEEIWSAWRPELLDEDDMEKLMDRDPPWRIGP